MEYKDIREIKPSVIEMSLELAKPDFEKNKEFPHPQHGKCGFEQGIELSLSGTTKHINTRNLDKEFLVQYAMGYIDANQLRIWTEDRIMPIPPKCCQTCESMRDCYAIVYSGKKQMGTKFIKNKPTD